MNWMGLCSIIIATLCGIDAGIAVKEKNRKSIVFNSVIILVEWAYTLFNMGIM